LYYPISNGKKCHRQRQDDQINRLRTWLLYAPFIVLGMLFPINFGGHLYAYPLLGISEDTGIAISMILIGIGLLLGLVGVVVSQQMRWYWRILVATAYIPAIGVSLILSGM